VRRAVPEARPQAERGSAIVDFVLVGALLTVLFVAVLQLALTLHVRNTLIDCAAEGARYGALAGSSPAAGADRTRQLINSAIDRRYTEDVSARITSLDGAPVVEVSVRAPLPVLGLVGPSGVIAVAGRAYSEGAG
jgi:hypothetical protein